MIKIKQIISSSMFKTIFMLFAFVLILSSCKATQTNCSLAQEVISGKLSCEEYKAIQQRVCWQSSLIGSLYDAMGTATINAYKNLTNGAMGAIMIIFCVWFSFVMLKNYASFKEEKSPQEFWTMVLKKFFLCFICGFIASSTQGLLFFLNFLIFPVFNAFLELASHILSQATQGVETSSADFFGQTFDSSQEVCSVSEQSLEVSTQGFPDGPKNMMQCLVCNVSDKLSFGFDFAFQIMSVGWVMPKVVGFIILAIFTFVKLGFVFYLVDTIFKFAMMTVLMPIFIMGYAFEQTRGWIINAIKIILSGAAYLLAISVLVSLSIVAIVSLVEQNPDIFNVSWYEVVGFSPVLMVLLMIAFLFKKIMQISGDLSNQFVGSKITSNFQKALTGILGMVAQGLGTIISFGALLPVFEKIKVVKAIADKVRAAKDTIQRGQNRIKTLSGQKADDDRAEDKGDEQ